MSHAKKVGMSIQPAKSLYLMVHQLETLEELNGEEISGENRGRVSQEERLSAPAGW